ncbi:MAG: peptidoglycan synthetase [Bacteroidales bacterium]|nr:peptidoglycan synthetase [Bacteroidales bacterium]MBN2698493.1 peptidoglycan synthetase [Bacteroidales bacterium]
MNLHFIAIGGAVMHNLAIALHKKGYRVTGSDDEIFEPSRSRLEAYGLLPEKQGWFPERIGKHLDAVILGMHAFPDNPELLRAQETGVRIYSFPEYLYEQSKDKIRVVIGGSHGKTTITSMVMHVMNHYNQDFDYMVGSRIEGFETMVRITEEAEVIILEGDEYLSSPVDPRPKFLLYRPHIALLTGIAWDHMNVFPTFEDYLEPFRKFIEVIEPAGKLYYFRDDPHLPGLIRSAPSFVETVPYHTHPHEISEGAYRLLSGSGKIRVPLIGRHNMQNIQGALLICRDLGISDDQFYKAIQSFRGAARRQQLLAGNDSVKVYLDFAHAPSKVRATVDAFREACPDKNLIACFELHTFSSLNAEFLPQYGGSLGEADTAMVYFNPGVVRHKKLPALSKEQVKTQFGTANVTVYDDADLLIKDLMNMDHHDAIVLFMTSGNFSGLDLKLVAGEIVKGE